MIASVDPEGVDGYPVARREWECPCGAGGSGMRHGDDASEIAREFHAAQEHYAGCERAKASPLDFKWRDYEVNPPTGRSGS